MSIRQSPILQVGPWHASQDMQIAGLIANYNSMEFTKYYATSLFIQGNITDLSHMQKQ